MEKLSTFSAEAQLQLGQDLDRVQRGQEPLDSGSMGSTLPHVFELRDEDKDFWYRLLYVQIENKIYVLDCIKKKTNQTSRADMERSRGRLKAIKQEVAEQAEERSVLRKSKVIGHVTQGSVLDDLKVPPEMLAVFKVKAELHFAILEIASRFSQAELQTLLQESQPRISDFMRGKITKFSLETLLYYADRLKMHPQIRTTGSNNKTHLLEVFAAE